MIKKEKCDCGKDAVWCYMPGFSNGDSPYFCDDCISTKEGNGCSCNWHNINDNRNYSDGKDQTDNLPEGIEGVDWRWVISDDFDEPITKESGFWVNLDEKQRPYPCCEYGYQENGFYTKEYEDFLESECKRVGYNILSDPKEHKWFEEFGYIVWTNELIEKIENIIENK